MKKRVPGDYLDFVPVHNEGCHYEISAESRVTIYVENKGMFHWMARKLFHRPKTTRIDLDEMGNFIWPLLDGTRTIYQIGIMVRQRFGEKAEPLYERLVLYIRSLKNYGLVRLANQNCNASYHPQESPEQ